MKDIKKLLEDEGLVYEKVEVPVTLEERLKGALDKCEAQKKKPKRWFPKVAVACFVMMLIGFNLDAVVYYGQKLIGYEGIMNSQLKALNDLEKGQRIDKGYTFKNGVSFTLDGVMIDDTQLLAFYTIQDPHGKVDDVHYTMTIKGFARAYQQQSGQGQFDASFKEVKWITEFETPRFYEEELELKINLFGEAVGEEGSIRFKLDRQKAMGHVLKQRIDKVVQSENTEVRLDHIIAAPTKTVIEGTMQNPIDLIKEVFSGERERFNVINLQLIANGEALNVQGSSMTTNATGSKFSQEFDALPELLHSLEIVVESFIVDKDVEASVVLNKEQKGQEMTIEGQRIMIDKIYREEDYTFVTITTKEDILLSSVYLEVDGEKIELEGTDEGEFIKKGNEIFHTRTLRFPAVGEKYGLIVEKIRYTQSSGEIISIPIR